MRGWRAVCGVAMLAAARVAHAQAGDAASSRFAINAYDVTGATKVSAAEIERAVYPFAGPDRTPEDVEKAARALQAVYAAKGYEAVEVVVPVQPDELFRQGVVSLNVTEAPVAKVAVSGTKYHGAEALRRQVPSVVEGQPLDLKAFQRDIASANRYPDRQVTPAFKPGAAPGSIDVDLKVKDTLPYHASLEVNNDYSPSTTQLRLIGSARYTDFLELGHTLSATYIIAPQRKSDSEVFSASYTAPVYGTPWTLLAFGYVSNSDIAALGGSNVLGNGYQVGARAIYRLPAEKSFQSISFGADFKDFKQDIFVGGVAAGSAPIRYVPAVVEYTIAGADDTTSFDATLGVTAGLRIIKRISDCVVVVPGQPCSPVDQFVNRSANSKENFVHLNLAANYSTVIKGDLTAAFRFSGQLADSPLVTNEQYSVGGFSSVRGYLQTEAVGDDGLNTSFELRLPSLATLLAKEVDEFRFYGFVDAGVAHLRNTLPGTVRDYGLIGVGGGLRLKLFKYFTGEVAVGVPLTDGPYSSTGDPRATFTAKGEF